MYQPRLPFESSHVSRISTICIIQLHHHYVIHVSLFLEKKYIMSIKSSLVHRICVSRIHKPYIHIIKIQYPHIQLVYLTIHPPNVHSIKWRRLSLYIKYIYIYQYRSTSFQKKPRVFKIAFSFKNNPILKSLWGSFQTQIFLSFS